MYTRLVRFCLGSGNGDKAQQLADELVPLIAEQPGCQAVTVFADESDGECGVYVLWDTEANANAAAAVVRPKLNEHLAGHISAPPDARLFKVMSSK